MDAVRQIVAPGPLLPEMLAAVRRHTGLDFGPYLRGMVARRVWNRMLRADVLDPAAYLERLRADPSECERLASTITIKVSRFFRNPRAFEALREALGDDRGGTAWSAGCARGQEAYGIALLAPSLAVLGTDVDAGALGDAERGCYEEEELAEMPAEVRQRGFVPSGDPQRSHRVADAVRARVSFGLHDLLAREPAPGAFSLVACRNVLIYLDREAQRTVEGVLLEGLLPGGLLWLGEAEWPSAETAARLEVVSAPARLFRSWVR